MWFLAGNFVNPVPVTRTCSVPEGKVLFFPVLNASFFNSPNACGQGADSSTAKEMRAVIAPFIDGATGLSVTLDGQPAGNIRRIRSAVFEVSLPEDNVYDALGISCAAGVYSPTVDDGFYAYVKPLNPGSHTLHIQAESSGFVVDATYHLTVVPVIMK